MDVVEDVEAAWPKNAVHRPINCRWISYPDEEPVRRDSQVEAAAAEFSEPGSVRTNEADLKAEDASSLDSDVEPALGDVDGRDLCTTSSKRERGTVVAAPDDASISPFESAKAPPDQIERSPFEGEVRVLGTTAPESVLILKRSPPVSALVPVSAGRLVHVVHRVAEYTARTQAAGGII